MTWLWPIVAFGVAALAWLVVHRIAFQWLRSIHPPQGQGRTVTAAGVRWMFRNQSALCNNPYCRADLKRTRYEVDHIVPKSCGGPDGVGNAQLLCRDCNQL
jgi:5-methylcytosine-specific restriction endonuclease McrA